MRHTFANPAGCPKCAHCEASARYCKMQHATDIDGRLTVRLAALGEAVREHLDRECSRCGYVWLEPCADALEQETTPLVEETHHSHNRGQQLVAYGHEHEQRARDIAAVEVSGRIVGGRAIREREVVPPSRARARARAEYERQGHGLIAAESLAGLAAGLAESALGAVGVKGYR